MPEAEGPVGPADASRVPRFSRLATFARLPRLDEVGRWDSGAIGVPFDGGTSYRPGARFGRAGRVMGGDVVEVSPAYDHAEITAIAATHVLYDLVTIMAAPART